MRNLFSLAVLAACALALCGCRPDTARSGAAPSAAGAAATQQPPPPPSAVLDAKGPHQGTLVNLAGCPYQLEFVTNESEPDTISVYVLDPLGRQEVMLQAPGGVTVTVHRPPEQGGKVEIHLGARPPRDRPDHRGSFSSYQAGDTEIRQAFENRWPMTITVREWHAESDMAKTYTGTLFDNEPGQ